MKYIFTLLLILSSASVFASCQEELAEGDKVDQMADGALSYARELEAPFYDDHLCARFLQAAGYSLMASEYLMSSQSFYNELIDKGVCENDQRLKSKLLARKAQVEKLLIQSQMLLNSFQVKLSAHNCQSY